MGEGQQTNKKFREEKDKLQNQMKAKDLLNNLMAEKEVSVEKDGEGVVISYEGIHVSYEYEEIGRDTETSFKKLMKEVSKAPAPKQIGIGAAAGWVSGYMMKVGK